MEHPGQHRFVRTDPQDRFGRLRIGDDSASSAFDSLDEGVRVPGAEVVPLWANVDPRPRVMLPGLRVHRLSNLPHHTSSKLESTSLNYPSHRLFARGPRPCYFVKDFGG